MVILEIDPPYLVTLTWGQPLNLGSTWGQPGVNLGLTWGQPGVNLGSTWGQPGANLGSICTVLPGRPSRPCGSARGRV